MTAAGSRLSPYQRDVLAWLLASYRWAEGAVNSRDLPPVNRYWRDEGFPVGRLAAGTPRPVSASRSRSLRRLEDRGLILRRNRVSGDRHGRDGRGDLMDITQVRTVTVQLTAAGRELAEALEAAQ